MTLQDLFFLAIQLSIPLTTLQKDIKHNNKGDSASNTDTMLFKNNPEQIHVSIPAESMSSDPGQCNGENKICTIHSSLLGYTIQIEKVLQYHFLLESISSNSEPQTGIETFCGW